MVSEEHPTSKPENIPPKKRNFIFGDKNNFKKNFIIGF
tara:strand:- start:328 stop:441 length:114 start_codon:yes stop_codon:yes gene_type:complete